MAREEGYPALSAIMADALRSGGMGFCLADSEGRVVRRDGALSQWTPTPGLSLFEHPLMEGIRDAVLNLRHTQGDMILPAIGLQDAAGTFKLDIRFAWMQSENCLLITCFQASMRAEMEAMAAQARREWQILQEQLRAKEDRLAAQSRLLATFIANVPAAIAMLDHELRYVSASDRWRSDFRLSSGTTEAGRACRESLAGTSLRWQQGLATCLEGTESTCELDSYTRPNGRHEWLRWRFLPFELPDAKRDATRASGVLLFCEIITDSVEQGRKLSEQARRLRSANVDMRNFSLALSHDLQSPVRQMVKFAQLLDEETSTELAGDGRDFLNEIHAAGARMQRMIEGLLRYLRDHTTLAFVLYRIALGASILAMIAGGWLRA